MAIERLDESKVTLSLDVLQFQWAKKNLQPITVALTFSCALHCVINGCFLSCLSVAASNLREALMCVSRAQKELKPMWWRGHSVNTSLGHTDTCITQPTTTTTKKSSPCHYHSSIVFSFSILNLLKSISCLLTLIIRLSHVVGTELYAQVQLYSFVSVSETAECNF